MKPEKIIEKILEKYRFRENIPPETKKRMLSLRKSTYRSIMKRYGRWTIFFSTGASLYFWLKKFGSGITIQQAVTAVTTFFALSIAGLSVGAVYTVKKYVIEGKTPVIEQESVAPENTTSKDKKLPAQPQNVQATREVSSQIYMKPFSGENTGTDVLNSFRRRLAASMNDKGGKSSATLAHDPSSPFLVTGSIVRLGKTYRVTLRLVERETSRVILMESASAITREELRRIADSMAAKIIRHL